MCRRAPLSSVDIRLLGAGEELLRGEAGHPIPCTRAHADVRHDVGATGEGAPPCGDWGVSVGGPHCVAAPMTVVRKGEAPANNGGRGAFVT